jgi:NAD-dependent deacetylase sirtuin 2
MAAVPLVEGLPSLDVAGLAEYIKSGRARNIIILTGAGISTAAGIPDFRTPGTGLYSNLQKYNLTAPEDMFEINFFNENPHPFFDFTREFLALDLKPTPAHYFQYFLQKVGLLKRIYTQNIDSLDRKAGCTSPWLIQAHGSYATAHCLSCQRKYALDEIKADLLTGQVLICKSPDCTGIVKPDVMFYGEDFEPAFYEALENDFRTCDLLIVMGTSMVVDPFDETVLEWVPSEVPRVLINRQVCQTFREKIEMVDGEIVDRATEEERAKFRFGHKLNRRDIFLEGDCQEMVLRLVDAIGWRAELDGLTGVPTPPFEAGLEPGSS